MAGVSNACRQHIEIYIRELNQSKLWALQLYDSTAKIPSGLLNGNINQYGDFNQCLYVKLLPDSQQKLPEIKGQYCLASFQVTLKNKNLNNLKKINDLVHSHYAFKSTLKDSGHRVPRFSSIMWGICVPHKCNPNDVEIIAKNLLNYHIDDNKVSVDVLVESDMCQMLDNKAISSGTIVVGLLFSAILFLVAYATIADRFDGFYLNEFVACFSLRRNFKSLISLKSNENDIKAVHGIRFINAMLLIISHKSLIIFYYPYVNRTEMSELLGKSWSILARAASLYTDPFIMFSGMLTCYSIMKNFDKKKEVSLQKEYINRMFRIVPTLSALILFCTWILPFIGEGPQWPIVVNHHAINCKKYWWRNFLFIHNYFGFEKMCLTHTHHIGIDTQLFIIGVPLVIWMGKNKDNLKNILISLFTLAIISTLGRFYISYKMELSNFVHFGATVQQLFKTSDYMYILPMYRFTVYAIGIFLALTLRYSPTCRLSTNQIRFGWLICFSLFYGAFLWPIKMAKIDYKYNAIHNAFFAAFAPIAWCCIFAWIIYNVHHKYNTYIGDFFSFKYFIIWTRISYAVYLVQFPIFFYYVGKTKTSTYYDVLGAFINGNELFVILLFSIMMTLFIELPFQNIKNLLFKKNDLKQINTKGFYIENDLNDQKKIY